MSTLELVGGPSSHGTYSHRAETLSDPREVGGVSYTDKVLRCRECGADFVFSAGEQEFYALKGLVNEPGRCPDCRAARRSMRDGGGYGGSMGYSDRPRREMHPVVCAQCGQDTMVPFLPRGDRPVYCSACFEKVRVAR